MMLFALLLLCQDPVEMRDYKSSYLLTRPAAYTDRSSWPVLLDLPDGPAAPPEPDAFVITLKDRQDEAFVLACLTDVKTKYRVDPERTVLRGCGRLAGKALEIGGAQPELFAACVLYRPGRFKPVKKAPPCKAFVSLADPDYRSTIPALMVMRKDVEVDVLEPGPTFAVLTLKPRANLQVADEMQRQGRYLDATLVCIALLDRPELERLARTKLKSLEGVAVIEMAKVEIAVSERRYKDAYLRCRDAAAQFAWLPPSERLQRRLSELASRPEVKRAMETDD
jgi:hypothetical protein